MNSVGFVNNILSLLTIFSLLLSVVLIILLVFKSSKISKSVLGFASKNVVYLTLVVATVAMFGSLFFSEVAGYNPCKLCWYQRILIYPQVFLLWFAMIIKDKNIVKYMLLLSVLCIPVSFYHYLLQFQFVPEITCSVVGYSASCAEKFSATFGFVTIPLMAFATVLLNSVLSATYLLHKSK